jgi:hypothetical protein
MILDDLSIALTYAGIEGTGNAGIPWSHGLCISLNWSEATALLAAGIYRDYRAGAVVGLLVFSHWVLELFPIPSHFSSFSWRSWQWSYGHDIPCHPISLFLSVTRKEWDWGPTIP